MPHIKHDCRVKMLLIPQGGQEWPMAFGGKICRSAMCGSLSFGKKRNGFQF
jgi:hypothetical protein